MDPSISPSPPPGTLPAPLHLACPACSRPLTLEPTHVGIEGFCPECAVPIVARPDFAGGIAVTRLDQALPDESAPPPPLPTPGDALPQTERGFFVEARQPDRRILPLALGLGAAVLFFALLAATLYPRLVSRPVAAATAAPATPSAPTPPTVAPLEPEPPKPRVVEPEDPRKALLAAEAEKTLRAFLSADRPWEKLTYVVEPEEDLLSILDYQKLDAIAKDAPVRGLEIDHAWAETRWVSLASVPELDGTRRTFCLVHSGRDGTAKVDFSLHWQNRSNQLGSFTAGPPKSKTLSLRVEMRRLPSTEARPGLHLAVSQAFSDYAPVELSIPRPAPVAAEISARPGIDSPTMAIVELVWTAGGRQEPPVPTISRIVQWGLWAAEG